MLSIEAVKDSDIRACKLADRHYSRRTRGSNRMAGPGEHLILINPEGSWIIGFRKQKYRADKQQGIECFIFRNESTLLSSSLLLSTEEYITRKWGHQRVFTYVNPNKIKSTNPGFCFKQAHYCVEGLNKTQRLIILSKFV